MREEHNFQIKIGMLGAKAVGKTAMIMKFLWDKFDERYTPTNTVQTFYRVLKLDKKKVQLIIYDFPGDIRFREVRMNFLYNVKMIACVLVVDASDSYSYFTLTNFLSELDLTGHLGKGSLYFVLNKVDIKDKVISKDTLSALTRSVERYYGFPPIPVYETSAKTGYNISKLFLEVACRELKKIQIKG